MNDSRHEMQHIDNIVPVNGSLMSAMVWRADIDYFDGPLLSYFRGMDGTHWLYQWIDCDLQFNRWMAMRVSKDLVDRLLASVDRGEFDTSWSYTENPPQRSEILDPFVFLVDADGTVVGNRLWKLNVEDIPDWCFGELNASDENARPVPDRGTAESP